MPKTQKLSPINDHRKIKSNGRSNRRLSSHNSNLTEGVKAWPKQVSTAIKNVLNLLCFLIQHFSKSQFSRSHT